MNVTCLLVSGPCSALLICALPATESPAITIAENGEAKAAIVVDAAATPARRYAADDLAVQLRKITGGDFKVQFRPAGDRPNILVGRPAVNMVYPDFTVDGLGDDGIIIRTIDGNLIIAGGEPRGTVYAANTFLEDTLGCRWWAPRVASIPKTPTITVEAMDVRYVPDLEYRDWQFPTTGAWAARCRINGLFDHLESMHGKEKWTYIASSKWSSHTFWTILPPEIYYETNPEYYTLIDGERVHKVPHYNGTSLCLTSKVMRREFVNNCRLALCWHPWANIFSISQIDDAGEPNRCTCGPCAASEAEDNPSGLILQFVNSVAGELAAEFPHVTFDTLAYHYSQAPPKKTRARDDVIIRLSDIGCSFNTPIAEDRDDNPRHNQFREDLVGWSKMADRLYIWDYGINFTYHGLPHPNLRTFGRNVRFLIDHNVKGIFVESHHAGMEPSELAELRAWLFARLMWKPHLDAQALIEEFCRGYYGPMGEHLIAYVNLMHDAVAASGDYLNLSSPPDAKFLSIGTLSRAWAILQEAEAAAGGHPAWLSRLQNPKKSVLYAFAMAYDRLRKEAEESGTPWPLPESQMEVHDMLHPPGPEVVISLPGKWRFKTDPNDAGLSGRWDAGAPDDSWVPISIMKDWVSQGHDHHGVAWYRTSFRLPEGAGTALRLAFGAIDGDAVVILNGQTIAELTGHAWDRPVHVNLPHGLAAGAEHRLAVRVIKHAYGAGIWKPVRIVR